MSCPDINRLIDFHGDGKPDADLEAHLEECPACQADLRLLQELSAAFRPEIEVPEYLIQRVLAELPLTEASSEGYLPTRAQVLGAGLLGSLTGVFAIFATSLKKDVGDPVDLLLFSLAVGLVASVGHVWLGREPGAGEI